MKSFIGVLGLLSLVIFSSCTELSDDIEMTCTIDGEAFEATAVVAVVEDDDLVVTGTGGVDKQVELYIRNCTSTGVYDININTIEDNVAGYTVGLDASRDIYLTSSGTGVGNITINTLSDSNVEGTFDFTAKNAEGTEVVINNGSFKGLIK
eukprot:gnl/TRDRNA2_/TRDRNA2_195958_c0_seq1.p1 gnl/TRDRNA2_/TRDRNA2_195958_c0~~gnl/TRDRNA2_/TRDRNA2_195958_c0_seq1.p1  ORF type:complete len:151 (+),score=13.44 gnl/TRDRNA2_/TRDRNA2_195958_c0_seq1:3-455(+)